MQVLLNPEQQKAVEKNEGPLLIIAGAGAGKTKTITERIVHIIKNGTSPHSILAITFTNKAAKEMRERVQARLVEEGIISSSYISSFDTPVIKTFHSFGVYVLRRHALQAGLTRNFIIKDASDASSILKQCLKDEGIDPKEKDPGLFKNAISRYKSDFVSIESLQAQSSHTTALIARVWRRYEEALKKENSVDFDDLLTKTVTLLREHADVRKLYQQTFRYIHVDEYQDTNAVQYELCRLLAEQHHNICVVGDGDQNIYSWRGADIKNILQFEKEYPEATVILLEENYRSTGTILDAANAVIKKNSIRKDKNLFTQRGRGELITLIQNYDEVTESKTVVQKCADLLKGGTDPSAIAVLYRANFQSRILEDAFLRQSVPYQVLGTKFFERREVKDVISYLRAALNRQSLTDVKRAIESPKRGIGKMTLLKIFTGQAGSLPSAMQKKIETFFSLLDSIQKMSSQSTLSETLAFIIEASGLESTLRAGSDEDRERLENVRELVSVATKYDELDPESAIELFFEESTLVSDQDTDQGASGVKLMTVHASKGLEFEYVFVVGLEHDLFPHRRIGANKQTKEESEEERRLFYVALTRAKQKLFLSYAQVRTIYGMRQLQIPSEFLSDIASELTDYEEGAARESYDEIVYL